MAASSVASSVAFNVVGFAGLERQITVSYKTKRAMLVQGGPGTGKTEFSRVVCDKLIPPGGTVWYWSGAMKAREFVGGIMMPTDGMRQCRLLIPGQWADIKAGDCVIVDELDKITHSEQNMWLEPACTGSVDGFAIGEGKVLFIFLANDSAHKSGSFGVSPLIGNRSKVLWFQGESPEYLHHFGGKGVHHYIMAYLTENMGDICPKYDPTALRNATPRQWENASKELYAFGEGIGKADLITTLAGFVPDTIAHKVSVYYEFKDGLVPAEVVLADPAKAPLPKGERGLQFMQLHMIAGYCSGMEAGPKRGKAKTALWTYAKRFPAEYRTAVMPCLTTGGIPVDMLNEKEFSTYVAERKRILETGK